MKPQITIEDLKDFDTWKAWKNDEVELVGSEEPCCTPTGQIKRCVDCKGCDRKPEPANNSNPDSINVAFENFMNLNFSGKLTPGFVLGAMKFGAIWQKTSLENLDLLKEAYSMGRTGKSIKEFNQVFNPTHHDED